MGDARAKMEAKAKFLSRMDLEGGEATTSMRTTGDMTMSMRSTDESLDLDFSVTESGRTIAHLVVDHAQDDSDMEFSITSSGRTVEHFPPDVSVPDTMLDITNSLRSTKSEALPIQQRSPARPIPTSDETTLSQQGPPSSQPNSHGSSGSAFLNGLLNGETNLTTSGLSHTPPIATSYEVSHFGKRARSGSVSGRLRSASDLEEKGVIDRQQKTVLKDLIICGDEELHQALDLYEAGHTSQLESMIQTGALSDKAVPDLDLLGDLDLDFLSVNDHGMGSEAADMYNLQQQDSQPLHETAVASMLASKLPQHHSTSEQRKRGASIVSPEYEAASEATSDGIGELDFNTDYSDNTASFLGDPQFTTGINHRPEVPLPGPGERSRANSMFSEADASGRMRSNSLFSALLNEGAKAHNQEIQFGRWMDRYPSRNTQTATQSHTERIEESEDEDEEEEEEVMQAPQEAPKPTTTKKKGGIGASLERHKRKNESKARSESKAKAKQLLKEEKARLRQEKREAKEREKQRKKEERLQARLEKKKAIEEEKEREEHIPGSGKPHAINDPLLKSSLDDNGLLNVDRPDGWIGAYSPESRKLRINKFLEKRNQRVWAKTVKYDVRKNFADSRLRVKGRFVKKEDELLMRELMSLT